MAPSIPTYMRHGLAYPSPSSNLPKLSSKRTSPSPSEVCADSRALGWLGPCSSNEGILRIGWTRDSHCVDLFRHPYVQPTPWKKPAPPGSSSTYYWKVWPTFCFWVYTGIRSVLHYRYFSLQILIGWRKQGRSQLRGPIPLGFLNPIFFCQVTGSRPGQLWTFDSLRKRWCPMCLIHYAESLFLNYAAKIC